MTSPETPPLKDLAVAILAALVAAGCLSSCVRNRSDPMEGSQAAASPRVQNTDPGQPAQAGPGPQAIEPGPAAAVDPPSEAAPVAASVPYKGAFPPAKKGLHEARLTVSGRERRVVIYHPGDSPEGEPLLLVFHGTNDDPRRMVEASGAQYLADRKDMVVISPAALKLPADWDNHTGSETYWQTYPEVDPGKNQDLLLVQALIQEAIRAYKVDRRRVYVLGHSNGGFFALLAAMTLRDRVAAFAANSSGLVRCPTTAGCKYVPGHKVSGCAQVLSRPGACSCSGPEKPLALPATGRKVAGYLSHATDDKVVTVYYTCDLARRMEALGHPVKVELHKELGHGMAFPLAASAWEFISDFKLP